jgi:HlyD family secretion protein
MSDAARTALAVSRICSAGVSLLLLIGCDRPDPNLRQGYIEGDFVYVSSPFAGRLDALNVRRGSQVKAGEPLFSLDSTPETAVRDEAARRRTQGLATLEDARKGLRPTEIDSRRAQLKQAQSALDLAQKEVMRQEKLIRVAGATTEQDLDRARATRDQNRDRVAQLQAELKTAQLGARPDQVRAAEANLKALDAALAKAEWELSQKQQAAPQPATVFDTLYRLGEWIPAGRPVVTLLPLQNVKLRVFIPQQWLGTVRVGDLVQVYVDGAAGAVTGKVSFISPRAEYTPPVIYSRENRSKFVYLVEALFEANVAERLHPGQPVDVRFDIAAAR